jgi:hypothetical protein
MVKRDRQYAHNVTMKPVRATIVALEQQLSIKPIYSKCVFVTSGTQHAMRLHHIAICGLSVCTIFLLHYLITGTILEIRNGY